MHKQPVYQDAPAYVNGVSEAIFKVGVCLPAGPMVTDDDVRYIVESIKRVCHKSVTHPFFCVFLYILVES